MKKINAFTLVELLGVIVILGVLALIAIPSVNNIIDQNKEKLYKTQIVTIKDGLKRWADSNSSLLPEDGDDPLIISLGLLKLSGFANEDIKNPNTNLCFSNGMLLSISALKDGYTYSVDEGSGLEGISSDCSFPTENEFLYLKGSSTIKINLGDTYNEPGFLALNTKGENLTSSVVTIIKDKNNNVVSNIDTSLSGTWPYIITYTYKDILKTRIIDVDDGDPAGTTYVFDYTGAVQTRTMKRGTYKLEVWGAQGDGNGGYSVGNITFLTDTNIFVYVGGNSENKGYNGGAISTSTGTNGGGGSDIRIGTDSLYARVIVAGGGGGSWTTFNGGAGGGTSGIKAKTQNSSAGTPGTQISAGYGGSFGLGGTTVSYCAGGGGGGWYGGGSNHSTTLGDVISNNGGGGGSGWTYTASTFTLWQNGNSTDAANWLLNSSYYLSNASTIDGTLSMPTHDGASTMIGNTGNGYIKITKI